MIRPKIIRKKFSPKLWANSDGPAREATKHYFHKLGVVLVEYANDKDNFGCDLIDEQKRFFIECERKLDWRTERWPYDSVHVLERKTRMLLSAPTFLCIVSNKCDRICLVHPDVLNKYLNESWSERIDNRLVSNEKFYNIPLTECQFDSIKESVTEFFGIDDKPDRTAEIAKFYGFSKL